MMSAKFEQIVLMLYYSLVRSYLAIKKRLQMPAFKKDYK